MEKTYVGSDKVKATWDNSNDYGTVEGKDPKRVSWPSRHYLCMFCSRKFNSAQALGGHMNIHRRDRAMLRSQMPPSWVLESSNPNPNPNPNCTFLSSSSSWPPSNVPPCAYTHPSLLSPSLTTFSSPSSTSSKEEQMSTAAGARRNPLSPQHEEELDLELRLGYT